jgi:hypothetical protein
MGIEAQKKEHCGPKRGNGAYWGYRWDARKESNRIRRENWKREIRDEVARTESKDHDRSTRSEHWTVGTRRARPSLRWRSLGYAASQERRSCGPEDSSEFKSACGSKEAARRRRDRLLHNPSLSKAGNAPRWGASLKPPASDNARLCNRNQPPHRAAPCTASRLMRR